MLGGDDIDTARCQGLRRDGTPCQAPPYTVGAAGWCWAHAPELAEERRAARAKGGRNRAGAARLARLVPASLRPVVGRLLDAIAEVHAGDLDPKRASAMASLAGAVGRLYAVAELEQRLADLEATAAVAGTGER